MSDNVRLSDAIRKAPKFGHVICCSRVDSPQKCDPGVGFSQFNSRPASRFIAGLSSRPRLQPAARRARRPSIATKRARAAARAARRRLATPDSSGFRARVADIRSAAAAPAQRRPAPNAASGNLAAARRAGLEMRRGPGRRREARRRGRKPRPRRSGSRCAARSAAARAGTAHRSLPGPPLGHRQPLSSSHSASVGRAAPGSSSGAHSVERAASSRRRRSGAPTIAPIRS